MLQMVGSLTHCWYGMELLEQLSHVLDCLRPISYASPRGLSMQPTALCRSRANLCWTTSLPSISRGPTFFGVPDSRTLCLHQLVCLLTLLLGLQVRLLQFRNSAFIGHHQHCVVHPFPCFPSGTTPSRSAEYWRWNIPTLTKDTVTNSLVCPRMAGPFLRKRLVDPCCKRWTTASAKLG